MRHFSYPAERRRTGTGPSPSCSQKPDHASPPSKLTLSPGCTFTETAWRKAKSVGAAILKYKMRSGSGRKKKHWVRACASEKSEVPELIGGELPDLPSTT
eukprot:scaffold103477_cov29-Tisochrysis_lutea.AAC.4